VAFVEQYDEVHQSWQQGLDAVDSVFEQARIEERFNSSHGRHLDGG